MNAPLRRISAVILVMFLVLIGALTYIQFVQASELNADSRNVRITYRSRAGSADRS